MKKKKFQKMLFILVLAGLLNACTTSKELVQNQNQEIITLQSMRKKILEREVITPWQRMQKEQELKMINEQIAFSMKTAREAQEMSNEQTRNSVSGVVTATGVVLGTALVIDKISR